jgi:hypothetical protein
MDQRSDRQPPRRESVRRLHSKNIGDDGFSLLVNSNTPTQTQPFLEAVMTHWRDTMVDRPGTDGAVDVTGWTISGLAVLGAVVAVWVFGI